MKKRILSVFIAMLFVMNRFPLSVIAEFEENIDLMKALMCAAGKPCDWTDRKYLISIQNYLEE